MKILLTSALIVISIFNFSYASDDKTENDLKLDHSVVAGIESLVNNIYVDEVDKQKLYENAIKGMLNGLDPHSDFLKPKEQEGLMENTAGKFGGIGIVINKKDDFIEIVSPIDDTPGFKAGLKSGDTIIKINDEIVRGMSLEDSVDLMRGEKGTEVRLTISRKNKAPFEVKIIRDIITIISAKGYLLEKNTAYIRISSFSQPTAKLITESLAKMTKENNGPLKSIIIDLRNNPGGLITSAQNISDIFLGKNKMVVYTKGRTKDSLSELWTKSADKTDGAKIVVLVNEGSASASEIVAGALQDHGRAVILGTKTFGKGSVQSVIPLKGGYGIKVTIARYYTPNGRTIQNEGIIPDVALKHLEVKEKEEGITFAEKDYKNSIEATDDKNQEKIDKDAQSLEHTETLSDSEKAEQEKIASLKKDYFVIEALNILKVLHLGIK